MKNCNIYYGEYTLDAWINMILNRSLELPPYQRNFVWTEGKVRNLLKSLEKGEFVPPVTIGTYLDENEQPHHYVLDGQQRLSALLLGKLNIFPKGNKFREKLETLADNNDDKAEENIKEEKSNVYAWKFKCIQDNGIEKTTQDEENYKKLDLAYDDKFWKEHCIGFSYIKPYPEQSKEEQKKYYSTLFRNINNSSVSLSDMECRASLYWLDSKWVDFFKPKGLLGQLKINNSLLDFARIAAILAQYKKTNNVNCIASGYSSRSGKSFEDFIEDFIYETVGEKENDIFINLNELFPNKETDYSILFNKIDSMYKQLDFPKEFETIIFSDLTLLGLVYNVIFEKKDIDISKKDEIFNKIKEKFNSVDAAHKKSPAAMTWLRKRLEASLSIYKDYLV